MAERDIIISSDDFPSNYKKPEEKKEEKPKTEKIVKSTVSVAKQSVFKRSFTKFFSEAESFEDLKTGIIDDYIIPTARDTVFEIVKMLASGILFGSTGARGKTNNSRPYYTSYSDSSNRNKNTKTITDNKVTSRNFYEFVFENEDDRRIARYDAEKVLNQLVDQAHEYGTACVADFCEKAGIVSEFTDNDYGWTAEDLVKRTNIVGCGKGYKIVFPDPKPIPKD